MNGFYFQDTYWPKGFLYWPKFYFSIRIVTEAVGSFVSANIFVKPRLTTTITIGP